MIARDPASPANARYMTLAGEPRSPDAEKAVAELFARVTSVLPTKSRVHASTQLAMKRTLAAIAADLLWAAHRYLDRWSFRTQRTKTYTGGPIPARVFKDARESLKALGLLEHLPGSYQRWAFEADDDPGGWIGDPSETDSDGGGGGRAARFRATGALLALFASHGITPTNVAEHFSKGLPTLVLELRRLSDKSVIDFEQTDHTRLLTEQVHSINAFLQRHDIRNCENDGLYRVFHCDREKGYGWNKGGRLWSYGLLNYQRMSLEERLDITIDGAPVAEVDLNACHFTIMTSLLHGKWHYDSDPYDIDGVPRSIVKTWMTITLSHSDFHKRWPPKVSKKYKEKHGRLLRDDHRVKDVEARVLARHPIIREWFKSRRYGSSDLMFIESEIMLGTVLRLMNGGGIPSLPIHDGLIVKAEHAPEAQFVLAEQFYNRTRLMPGISIDYAPGAAPDPEAKPKSIPAWLVSSA